MTPEQSDRLAKIRFGILSMLRASGAILMLLGLWVWHGDILRDGGWPLVGLPLFVVGLVESLIMPQILVRSWRTPPGS